MVFCVFIGLLGCSDEPRELVEAKANANADMHRYEEVQKRNSKDNSAVSAGLKWLFGVLDDTNLPEADQELLDMRTKVAHLLTDEYMLDEETIKKILQTEDVAERNKKIESYAKTIPDKIASKQRAIEVEARQARELEIANSDPRIGMTREDVVNSRWGKPEDSNTTITKYGISEQWVYEGYRYVYFYDGIVTSIQY